MSTRAKWLMRFPFWVAAQGNSRVVAFPTMRDDVWSRAKGAFQQVVLGSSVQVGQRQRAVVRSV
eukprot:11178857-Lingulodinium_polyedra.AAC.1